MSSRAVTPPYPIFTDTDGAPLGSGYIYVGVENLDPVTNPIAIYWDEALTIPALQPVGVLNGYPSRAGSPAQFFAGSNYSILVKNNKGVSVYSGTSSPSTLADDLLSSDSGKGDELITVKQPFTGAEPTTQHELNSRYVCVYDFMTDELIADSKVYKTPTTFLGGLDMTYAIQKAINWCSNNGHCRLHFPAGHYKYDKLYCDYDAIYNPGYNNITPGHIYLYGDGQMADEGAAYYHGAGYPYYGTVLESFASSGNCLTLAFSGRGDPAGTFPTRQHVIENMTLVGNVPAPGYILYNDCGPGSRLHKVSVIQNHLTGHGVYWRSSWGTDCENLNIYNSNGGNWPTSGGTGIGFDFGSSIFGGQAIFRSSGFEGFGTGFQVSAGAEFANIAFPGSWFQKNMSYGVRISSASKGVCFQTAYFEANSTNHILIDASSRVGGVQIYGGIMLGGDSSAWTAGPMIKVAKTTTLSVDGLTVFRPFSSIIDLTYYPANGTNACIKNCNVQADNTVPAGTYLFKSDTANIAVLENNWIEPGIANLKEYDVTKPQQYIDSVKGASFGPFGLAPFTRLNVNSNTVFLPETGSPVVRCNCTAVGGAVDLPLVYTDASGTSIAMPDGRQVFVINEAGSTQSFLVRNVGGAAIGSGVTLAPGEGAICLFSGLLGSWTALTGLTFKGI